jgi:hypothetical protein
MNSSLNKLLFESIKQILKEETQNIDQFIEELSKKHPMSDELKQFVRKAIVDSGCQKIEFNNLNMGAGVALHDKVIINRQILNSNLEQILFVVFHELAHQWQFKKYGKEKMYDFYLGETSSDDAARFMLKTENVADEFGIRKIREAQAKNLIDKSFRPKGAYDNVTIDQIKPMLEFLKKEIKKKNITSPEQLSEFMYNKLTNTLFDRIVNFFK